MCGVWESTRTPPPLPLMVWGRRSNLTFVRVALCIAWSLLLQADYIVSQVLNVIIQNFIQKYQPYTTPLGKSNFDNMPLTLKQCPPPRILLSLFLYSKWATIQSLLYGNSKLQNLHSAFLDIHVHSLGMYQGYYTPCVPILIMSTASLHLQWMPKGNKNQIRLAGLQVSMKWGLYNLGTFTRTYYTRSFCINNHDQTHAKLIMMANHWNFWAVVECYL